MLALQTGALLLPTTLWYDETAVLRGRVHPPVPPPQTGTRAEKAAVMTQAMADEFASGIAEHPEHWHMLQRLWLADFLVSDAREDTAVPETPVPGTLRPDSPETEKS
jgi:phosphatidylinositol dimannoside acyltransferase